LEIKRQMSAQDIAEVTELLRTAELSDGIRPLSDQLWLDLVEGGRAGFAGLVVRDTEGGRPIGYAQVSHGNSSWALELVIDPSHRDHMTSLGVDLLRAALDVVAHEGGGNVHWWVFEPTPTHTSMAERVGLTPGRTLHQMRRPLPTDEHAGVPTRAFEVGRDEDAWLHVNHRAFWDLPEQGGWDRETLRQREKESWFDPAGFRLHERDGRLAAFCWTKVHHDQVPVLGEIYVIGVDPDFQGLGLGRALTLAGLDHLAGRHVTIGMLYVDADNEAGIALYVKLGFEIHRTDRAYTGEVAAA
jgi:mycothiol synthase